MPLLHWMSEMSDVKVETSEEWNNRFQFKYKMSKIAMDSATQCFLSNSKPLNLSTKETTKTNRNKPAMNLHIDVLRTKLRICYSGWCSIIYPEENLFLTTVGPLLSGHPGDFENWPLNRGWPFKDVRANCLCASLAEEDGGKHTCRPTWQH